MSEQLAVENEMGPRPAVTIGAARADHVIICGLGNLGYRIYEQLDRLGFPLIVVDNRPDARFAAQVSAGGERLMVADPRKIEVLDAAGVASACALITTFDDDLTNLEIALDALRLRPELRVIMRFFNVQIAPGVQNALPNVTLLSLSALASPTFVIAARDRYARNAMLVDGLELAMDSIVSKRAAGAGEFLPADAILLAVTRPDGSQLLFPRREQRIEAGDRVFVLGPVDSLAFLPGALGHDATPRKGDPLRGMRLAASRFGMLLANLDRALYVTLLALLALITLSVALFVASLGMDPVEALYAVLMAVTTTDVSGFEQGSEPFWLRTYGVFLLIAGVAALTIIYAFVTNYVVSVKLSGLLGQRPVTMRDHIVLCGLGTVGYRVLEGLIDHGEQVAVIERNADNRFLPLVRAHQRQARVFVADARLLQSLELVNAAAARCIITATDDDLGNLETALNARQLNPTIRVVLRTFDQALAQQVAANFNIQIALSATTLAAPAFVAAALGHSVVQSLVIGDHFLSVMRLVVPQGSPVVGEALGEFFAGLAARALYHTRRGEPPAYAPPDSRLLSSGDVLVLVATDDALGLLKARLVG